MVNLPLALAFLVSASPAPQVELVEKPGERHLAIDGKPTLIKGMNWGWMPIGQNYTFQFFEQPREVIIEALERETDLAHRAKRIDGAGIEAERATAGVLRLHQVASSQQPHGGSAQGISRRLGMGRPGFARRPRAR